MGDYREILSRFNTQEEIYKHNKGYYKNNDLGYIDYTGFKI